MAYRFLLFLKHLKRGGGRVKGPVKVACIDVDDGPSQIKIIKRIKLIQIDGIGLLYEGYDCDEKMSVHVILFSLAWFWILYSAGISEWLLHHLPLLGVHVIWSLILLCQVTN